MVKSRLALGSPFCFFRCSSPCRKWPNTQTNGCWLPPSDHIQSETLFQTRKKEYLVQPVFCIVDTRSCHFYLPSFRDQSPRHKQRCSSCLFCLQHFTGHYETVKLEQKIWNLLNQMFSDPENFSSSIQGVMGSWLGVMVNQISPLGYNDQERETNEMLTLVLILLNLELKSRILINFGGSDRSNPRRLAWWA